MSEEEKKEPPTDDSPPTTERNVVNNELQIDNELTQPSTIINEPSTNMEVHKHPHHVTHKKKWGEYLLEFFMLLLAVFLGFVAENYREHIVEVKKEKQIIRALYNDIKKDTINLNDIIYRYIPEHSAWEDSAEVYINSWSIKGNEKKLPKPL
jgi:hypothetical protein